MKEIRKIQFSFVPKELEYGISELLSQLYLEISDDGEKVSILEGDKIKLCREGDGVVITYSKGKKHQFFRALSYLYDFIRDRNAEEIDEKYLNTMLCLMADMSRNAVYNIDSAKRMIRYLALMGYDSLMLYTEDTYTIDEYKYFGHMRGRFSKEELREIDDYAYSFGIEVIPTVQMLAHMAASMRWPDFTGFKDTEDILMVGDERTYKFLDAVLKSCAECFRSRRINVGMDEAHMLGRGDYLLRNGYRKSSEIMLEHLSKVVELCNSNGFSPMMWSDMFFRMAFGTYYVKEGEIEQGIIDKMPENMSLIYWDYYSKDREKFSHMVDCHVKFNNPTLFAGGAWKWSGFAPHNRFSLNVSEMMLDECMGRGLNNIIVTAWGDNGGEASQFSMLPCLLYFAERSYFDGHPDSAKLEKRACECFDIGFEDLLTLDSPNELYSPEKVHSIINPCKYLLYNDPLGGLLDKHLYPDTISGEYREIAEKLAKYADDANFGYMFNSLASLCKVLEYKADMSYRLREAYKADDRAVLKKYADEIIPETVARLDKFITDFRAAWYKDNKTFGFDVEDIRLGGLRQRLVSAKERLEAYLSGKDEKIEELEQPMLSMNGASDEILAKSPYIQYNNWKYTASGCVI